MKNREKIRCYCFIFASICLYISAIIGFSSKGSNDTAVTHLCLGSAFLCLSTVHNNKENKDNKK